jgi:hypothetical protein
MILDSDHDTGEVIEKNETTIKGIIMEYEIDIEKIN